MDNYLTLQYYSTFPQMCQLTAHNSGSGRVFSGCRIWPKYGVGFEKTQNILRGKGFDCYLERGIHWDLGTGCRIFLSVCREFEILYILTVNAKQRGERTVVSTIKANYFTQLSNQQMSSQKIKTQCLNWMPGKCTWYLKSRINSKKIERAKLHLPLISFCCNKSFSNLLILETKKWDLGKRWKKCGMWDFREKGEGMQDQDPTYQTLIIIVYPFLVTSPRTGICSRGSLLGVKKAWGTPRLVSFRGLTQNFWRASPPLSYEESPAPRG